MSAFRLSNTAVGLSAAVVSLPAVCVATRRRRRGKQRLFAMEIGGGETVKEKKKNMCLFNSHFARISRKKNLGRKNNNRKKLMRGC